MSRLQCLARQAGHRGSVEKALALSGCKASASFGTQVPRGREARTHDAGGAILRAREKREAAERTSGLRENATSFAGRRANPRPLHLHAFRGRPREMVRAPPRERIPPLARARARRRGVRSGSRRGLFSSKDEPNLRSSRSGPAVVLPAPHGSASAHFLGSATAWLVSRSHPSSWGTVAGEGVGGSSPLPRTRKSMRLAVVPVHRRICRSSAERPRAQRSESPVSVGSKACTIHGARDREPDGRRRSGA